MRGAKRWIFGVVPVGLTVGLTLGLTSGLAGCERSRAPTGERVAATRDGGIDARDLEPTDPPPAPTVKPAGKGDCQTAYAPRPSRDPNPMCKIDGGTFGMGADEDDPTATLQEKPRRRVTVSAFYLDQFEVTNAQMLHFLKVHGNWCGGTRKHRDECVQVASGNAVVHQDDRGGFFLRPGQHLTEPFDFAFHRGAEAYCAWAGKRLPTEAEWEFAARHDPRSGADLRYPWGEVFKPNHAACDEGACADGFVAVVGDRGTEVTGLAPVGTFDGTGGRGDGSSPWGVHDLAGNAEELVADFYVEPYPPCGDCVDPVVSKPAGASTDRAVRTFVGNANHRLGNPSITQRGPKDIVGFRCARDLIARP